MATLEELRYPIGQFSRTQIVSVNEFAQYINEIERLPFDLRKSVSGLSDSQLDTPYREGGWTIRQVVHHLFDSHVNSYMRLKLALTENNPTIRPYDEASWAELHDARQAPVDLSLGMIEGLHKRWMMNLRSLNSDQIARTYIHPESGLWRIDQNAAMYAWHGKHHLAHINGLKQRMGW